MLFLVLMGAGAASIYFLYQVNNEFKMVLRHEMPITDVISRITVYKLEQTSWLERALRYADIAARSGQDDEENTRLLIEAKAKFKEIAKKVEIEIDDALAMSTEAQKHAQEEEMINELRSIHRSLISIREEYAGYIDHVSQLFALFSPGNLSDAQQAASRTEKLEEDFNQRLESFSFESKKNSQRLLSRIEEREAKAIIIVAMIISIALLFTVVTLFFNYISLGSRKTHVSRDRINRK